MKRMDVNVAKRSRTGKGGARSTRRAGRIPAILYGEKKDAIPVSVDRLEFEQIMRSSGESENILVNMKIEDEPNVTLALVRQGQHDPLTGVIEHIDFLRVSTDKPIRTTVPIHPTGTPKGVREGGVFEIQMRDVEIECLPLNIPDFVEVDVSHLEIGQALHVSDIPHFEQYKILSSDELTVAVVSAPKLEIAHAAPAEGAAASAAEEGAKEQSAE